MKVLKQSSDKVKDAVIFSSLCLFFGIVFAVRGTKPKVWIALATLIVVVALSHKHPRFANMVMLAFVLVSVMFTITGTSLLGATIGIALSSFTGTRMIGKGVNVVTSLPFASKVIARTETLTISKRN